MNTTKKSMLLLGLTVLAAVIQGSVAPPTAEATELSPASLSTELTVTADLHDVGPPEVVHLASVPHRYSGHDGPVTNVRPETVASDTEGPQLVVHYERVTSFGLCWWFCALPDRRCPCVVIYFW